MARHDKSHLVLVAAVLVVVSAPTVVSGNPNVNEAVALPWTLIARPERRIGTDYYGAARPAIVLRRADGLQHQQSTNSAAARRDLYYKHHGRTARDAPREPTNFGIGNQYDWVNSERTNEKRSNQLSQSRSGNSLHPARIENRSPPQQINSLDYGRAEAQDMVYLGSTVSKIFYPAKQQRKKQFFASQNLQFSRKFLPNLTRNDNFPQNVKAYVENSFGPNNFFHKNIRARVSTVNKILDFPRTSTNNYVQNFRSAMNPVNRYSLQNLKPSTYFEINNFSQKSDESVQIPVKDTLVLDDKFIVNGVVFGTSGDESKSRTQTAPIGKLSQNTVPLQQSFQPTTHVTNSALKDLGEKYALFLRKSDKPEGITLLTTHRPEISLGPRKIEAIKVKDEHKRGALRTQEPIGIKSSGKTDNLEELVENAGGSRYEYSYRVIDHGATADFGHEETREGKVTSGRYHVLLPDGLVQLVEYTVDSQGYHADVTYVGRDDAEHQPTQHR